MTKKVVFTKNAPEPVGPYSQAILNGESVFVSGQIPLNPKTSNVVEGGIKEQTVQVLENIKHVLESVDLTLDDVVKTSVFLADLGDFQAFNTVYATYFVQNPPARTTVQAGLMTGVLIEIDAIAKK
ncbi:MAG: Rid family detoxifying hydrolase [Candidatus Bathyarchaeota archaeon]|nr:Rid family detoxifying hydrolase [Candidatus Bathyarchaeota archaeon]